MVENFLPHPLPTVVLNKNQQFSWWQLALLLALCVATFAPVLNNGFIADDYVFLQDVERFKTEPLFLFGQAPLNYRMTTFLVFLLLKSVVGYMPVVFYAFNIAVHIVNCFLLWKLLLLLGRGNTEAYLAAILFAVFHGPQEAVMWSVAMGETLQGSCLLAILVLWLREKHAMAMGIYFLALFTKESAPLAIPLLAFVQWYRGQRLFTVPYLLFLSLTAAFGVFFVWMWTRNSFIQGGAYAVGPGALRVLALSVHRILWPWFYVVLFGSYFSTRMRLKLSPIMLPLGLMVLVMTPYMFLTYAKALPSRHIYLASMALASGMAYLLAQTPGVRFRQVFLIAFVGFNIGYVWVRKDKDFEGRAAPTEQLIKVLRTHSPAPTAVLDFAYPFPEIAKAAALVVPGWKPDLIRVGETCDGCLTIRWDSNSKTYIEER